MKIQSSQKYSKIMLAFAAGIMLLAASPLKAPAQNAIPCYVPADETVVRWKTEYTRPCEYAAFGICIWPIRHPHVTYKVTVNSGTPLRDEKGHVIAATEGEQQPDWGTYDSNDWNMIRDIPFQRVRFPGYQGIGDNEYVVMVETRYRLFHNVEKTLGICIQQP